jgi:hypothetical protein
VRRARAFGHQEDAPDADRLGDDKVNLYRHVADHAELERLARCWD